MADEMDANGVDMKDSSHSGGVGKEADPDAIRMFVGQIPRQWTETELIPLFEEYGDIHKIVVLKDRASGTNRGCCFVTYCSRRSALEAQIALHGVRILPGVKHPVQMKPADNDPSKNSEERKLFIGMISKKYSEEDLSKLFSPYGTIEECVILRDPQGNSRSCAFVQYTTRQSCINAIRSLNRSQVMEGCSGPLTVKFCETAKEKERKKQTASMSNMVGMKNMFSSNAGTGSGFFGGNNPSMSSPMFGNFSQAAMGATQQSNAPTDMQQQMTLFALTAIGQSPASNAGPLLAALGSMPNMGAVNNLSNLNPQVVQALALLVQPNQPQPAVAAAATTIVNALSSQMSMNLAMPGPGPSNMNQAANVPTGGSNTTNQLATLLAAFQQSQIPQPPPGPPPPITSGQTIDSSFTNTAGGSFGSDSGMSGNANQMQNAPPSSAGLNLGANSSNIDMDSFTSAFLQGVTQYAQSQASNQLGSNNAAGIMKSGGKQSEGPEGANLFIYHLPQEYTDNDLSSTFAPFGTILSAKVFVDKQTNMSKCFGFVSFDNSVSAQNAIQNMNGFTIGRKKLRVQLKKESSKPY